MPYPRVVGFRVYAFQPFSTLSFQPSDTLNRSSWTHLQKTVVAVSKRPGSSRL